VDERPNNIKPECNADMFAEFGDELLAEEKWSSMLEDIMYSKYIGDEYCKQVLLATDYALLVEGTGKNLKLQIPLMNVRERIRQEIQDTQQLEKEEFFNA
jgi:hypothetical protein